MSSEATSGSNQPRCIGPNHMQHRGIGPASLLAAWTLTGLDEQVACAWRVDVRGGHVELEDQHWEWNTSYVVAASAQWGARHAPRCPDRNRFAEKKEDITLGPFCHSRHGEATDIDPARHSPNADPNSASSLSRRRADFENAKDVGTIHVKAIVAKARALF